jgi:putative sugar O-methyltransferase
VKNMIDITGDITSHFTYFIRVKLRLYTRNVLGYVPLQFKLWNARLLRRIVIELESAHIPNREVNDLIKQQKFDQAEQLLLNTAAMNPADIRIGPYITRVRFLKERASNPKKKEETDQMLKTLETMKKEFCNNYLYEPNFYWDIADDIHIQLLIKYGIENFKRTVSHGYQNWEMCSLYNPQVRALLKTMQSGFTEEPWRNIIETPDHVGNHDLALGIPTAEYMDTPIYRLALMEDREIYRISVGLLWEHIKSQDNFQILETLEESTIGNPIRIWRNGKLISSDLAHSIRERNILFNSLTLNGTEKYTVGEIGAGHGRLAEIFGRTTNYRYLIFDIVPALYVSQWYIQRLFPNEKVFTFRHFDKFEEVREEVEQSRFAFFTSNQIEMIPDSYFELFINLNSFGEMRRDQITNFIGHIDRLTKLAFLSRQELKSISKNPSVLPLERKDYDMPKPWHLIIDKNDDYHPFYFNHVWKKSE